MTRTNRRTTGCNAAQPAAKCLTLTTMQRKTMSKMRDSDLTLAKRIDAAMQVRP